MILFDYWLNRLFFGYLRNLYNIMKVLLKQARIVCSISPYNGLVQDILIADGIIQNIADEISDPSAQIVSSSNLHVSLGWMDVFADFCDPGYEYRETLVTGASAAAAGGFTDVMIIPNTSPALSSKTQIEYILQKASTLPVNIHPIGSITKNAEGKDLAEMYDMSESGAVAFSDGIKPVQHTGIMIKALQYVLANQKTIIQMPDDKSVSAHGLVNEGIISTQLGLPGKPAIAEEIMIARDIELLRYTRSRLHITGVSTQKGVELIMAAKNEGLHISCSTTPYHCYFCDEDLSGYDTNLKVNPPLRTREDMMAIKEAVRSGAIDIIASHHIPLHWDDKNCEFEYAKNGMIGLETLFPLIHSTGVAIDRFVEMMTIYIRKIMDIKIPQFNLGEVACLTIFDPSETYTFEENMIKSSSKNSPFIGKELTGKVLGIVNKHKVILNS